MLSSSLIDYCFFVDLNKNLIEKLNMDHKKSYVQSNRAKDKTAQPGTNTFNPVPASSFYSRPNTHHQYQHQHVNSIALNTRGGYGNNKTTLGGGTSIHFMSNLIKQRKRINVKRSVSGTTSRLQNCISKSPSSLIHPRYNQQQNQYGRKMVVTSQDLRRKLDARRKIQEEERKKQLEMEQQQPEVKQEVDQERCCSEKLDADDDPVIILDTRKEGTNTPQMEVEIFNRKSPAMESASSNPTSSSSLSKSTFEDFAKTASTKTGGANKPITFIGGVAVKKEFGANQQQYKFDPSKTPFKRQYGQQKFKGGDSRSSGIVQDARISSVRVTSVTPTPLLPTPKQRNNMGAGGAWKTYAQARTEERIPRYRLGKNLKPTNSFNFEFKEENPRFAPFTFGEISKSPSKIATVVESSASKCYETMLTTSHDFHRLCKVGGMEAAKYAYECSPGSFIATESKWGNGLMPVMPRISPPVENPNPSIPSWI